VVLLSQELPVPSSLAGRKDFLWEMSGVSVAAARAQARVYVLQLDVPLLDAEARLHPPTAVADADIRSFGLETVATLAGGRRLMISGTADAAFDRVARETAAFYLLGFEPEPGDRDGKPHTVTVKSSRQGAEVRARRQFVFASMTVPVPAPALAAAAPVPAAAPAPVEAVTPPPPQAVTPPPAEAVVPPQQPAAVNAAVPAAAPAQPPTGPLTLELVLQRMGTYVSAYGERAALIVAAETYTQRISTEDGASFPPRKMLAEFAIVKAAGPTGWIGFRDVVQVDGENITDRRGRLLQLLSDTNGDVSEAKRISNESARFNIGPISRNFNVPTTTLYFFHPATIGRFTFEVKSRKKIDGLDTWVLEFKETRRPTMVMTRDGRDVPCEGTVWVSPSDGTILRTQVTFRGFADDKSLQQVNDKRRQQSATTNDRPNVTPSGGAATSSSSQSSSGGSKGSTTTTTTSGQAKSSGSATGAGGGSGVIQGKGPTPQELFSSGFETRKLETLARIDVTYKRHDAFGMWLPAKMSELYEGPIPRGARAPVMGQATTTADYGDFKQFGTSVKIVK
jgi:hypothetical protein